MRLRILLFFLLPSVFLMSQTDQRTEKLDLLLDQLATHEKMRGSVAFMEDGEIVYQRAIGAAAEDHTADTETAYRIGSISKTFTATMIFQLIDEGKLSLDTKLSEFYPQFPNAKSITIGQLLGHRSGLASLTSRQDYQKFMTRELPRSALVDMMAEMDPVFTPDEKSEYSNTNYILLGYIIERVEDQPYSEVLSKRITEPLNLERTRYGQAANKVDNTARSYTKDDDGNWSLEVETHMSIPHGAGAIESSPSDLTRFFGALFGGKLVSETALAKMRDIKDGLGMGLFAFPLNGKTAYGHGGSIDAFLSNAAFFPEEKVAIALTTNGMDGNMNEVMIGLLSIWFGMPYEMPDFSAQSVSLDVSELKPCVGNFASKAVPLEIEFRLEDGALMAQATGQPVIPLTAYGPTDFRFEQAGLKIEFSDQGEDGKFQNFTLHQGGGSYSFFRKD